MAPVAFAVGSAALSVTGSFAVASALATATPYILVAAAGLAYSQQQQQRQLQALESSYGVNTPVNDDRGLQEVIFEANPAFRLPLGTAIHAGIPYFAEGTEATRPHITYGLCLSMVPCGDLIAVWLNNRRCKIGSDGYAEETPFNDGSTAFVEVQYQSGTLDQGINPILSRDFGDLSSKFKLPNMCEVVIKAHYGTGSDLDAKQNKHRNLYGDSLKPVFEHNGALVYDPRNAFHDLSDVQTWETTSNPTLNTMRYLQWKFPHLVINWDKVAEFADIDDQWVFNSTGAAHKRNGLDGVVKDDDDAFTVISDMLTANAGSLILEGGRYYVMPAHEKTAVGTLHGGMVKGGYQIDFGVPFSDRVDGVIPEFFAEDRDRKIVPGPAAGDTANADRVKTLRMPFERNSTRAQAKAHRAKNRATRTKSMSCTADLRASDWKAGDVINVYFTGAHSRANGQYEILSVHDVVGEASISLSLQEYNIADERFDPAQQEQDFSLAA